MSKVLSLRLFRNNVKIFDMTTIEIKGTTRSDFGKKGSKNDRSNGLVPAVMYGGNETIHFTVTPASVKHLVYTPDFKIADIDVDGKNYRGILKSVQFHPVTEQLLHIDFLRLVEKTPIKVEVPLRFKGSSPGVKLGGKLIQQIRKIKIKTTPEFLVDELKADISKLDLGQALRVREVTVPQGVEIMNNGATPVALIEIPRALKAAAAAEAKAADKGAKKKK
jgi:large subunit ribosomal protein L25